MVEAKLVQPSSQYEQAYLDMLSDWRTNGGDFVPFVLKESTEDFEAMVKRLKGFSNGNNIPGTFVPHSTYWLIADERMVGVVNIRHLLNEQLLLIGGNIGYGIRPSDRRKGYATLILKLAIEKAKELGLTKVLVTCDKDNIGSAKTILNNGGVLESEYQSEDGNWVQRYWISL